MSDVIRNTFNESVQLCWRTWNHSQLNMFYHKSSGHVASVQNDKAVCGLSFVIPACWILNHAQAPQQWTQEVPYWNVAIAAVDMVRHFLKGIIFTIILIAHAQFTRVCIFICTCSKGMQLILNYSQITAVVNLHNERARHWSESSGSQSFLKRTDIFLGEETVKVLVHLSNSTKSVL